MGTTADKLNYLYDTKKLIQQSIIDKGVNVENTDTFRSYAEKISQIYTGSGILPPRYWEYWTEEMKTRLENGEHYVEYLSYPQSGYIQRVTVMFSSEPIKYTGSGAYWFESSYSDVYEANAVFYLEDNTFVADTNKQIYVYDGNKTWYSGVYSSTEVVYNGVTYKYCVYSSELTTINNILFLR